MNEYFIFSTPEGYKLCRQIILEQLGYGPHDYQLEGVCKALDGVDILAVTPTGSGKTGFLVMYMLVMRAITARPELCSNPPPNFRKRPAMVVVCPTLALEEDMVRLACLVSSALCLTYDKGKEILCGPSLDPAHQ